jgi:serine phosphatase RsbU (regulator of sigma subunit)
MRSSFKILFAFLLFSLTGIAAVPDSLVNRYEFKKGKARGLNISLGGSTKIKHDKQENWLYYPYDDLHIKDTAFRDTNFVLLHQTRLFQVDDDDEDDKDHVDFNGFAWYKLYFKITSNASPVHYLRYSHLGAAEIYLDGKLIQDYGVIGDLGRKGVSINVDNKLIPLYISDTLRHCVAIRYQLDNYESLYKDKNYKQVGPYVILTTVEDVEEQNLGLDIYYGIVNMLAAFFFALFILHLMIYLFYREKKFNLYYSLFLLFLSLSFFELFGIRLIKDPGTYVWVSNIDGILFPTCCFFLVTLLNLLLNEKRTWHYILFALAAVYLIIDTVFYIGAANSVAISIVFYTYFNTMAHSIVAVRKKIPGSKFLGWGILSFTIFIILTITFTLLMAFRDPGGNWALIVMMFFLMLSVLSIPLSMSAYLAYDFSRTNKSLSDQLKANEALHNEKQELLSNQNRLLETQVTERTKEIADQNKVLEHQKKEITDSINYARRIQQALLPEVESIKASLPNSFVYYMPKDIVSGDFYFFSAFAGTAEHIAREGKAEPGGVLIAAADCTGHGVPGALMSMIVHEKLEAAVKLSNEPGEILHIINRLVKDALKQNQSEGASRDGCDIALCKIQGETLTYSGAYRPLYIFKKDNSFVEIKPTKTAIAGLTPHDQRFEQHQFDTRELKAVYMFSDGFADQFGGEKSKKLTTKKFKELLTSLVNLPVNDQKQALESFFSGWKGNIEQIDDVLVIGITFS